MTVAELLRERSGDDRPALFFEDDAWSWREFVVESAGRAALLASLRRPGPFHVGVLLENVPEFLFLIGGAALSGATVVGINPTRRGAELASDIRQTDCQLIVTDRAQSGLLEGIDLSVLLVDDEPYNALLREHAGAPVPQGGDGPKQNLLLLFTSGSTGAPKAVICTSGRLAAIAAIGHQRWGLTSDDVLYQSMPLFHGNALMANWAPALGLAAPVALRRKFSASGFLPDIRRFGATYFNYVGRALAYILATPEQPDDADNPLRVAFGTEASTRDMAEFSRRFACRLVEGYGSSEGAIAIRPTRDTPPGALGPADPGDDLVVLDPATAEERPRARFGPAGELLNADEAIGELVSRSGAGRFEGYYGNEEAQNERVRDGWYWSGDLCYRDEAGFFYFAGRGSDWLRVDSENFAAAPIERILFRLPSMVMAAVYPVPDPRTGDQVMAALELAPGEEFDPSQFAEFLLAQPDLGTKWAPRFVRLVSQMPLTATNKVDKQPLRRERWETEEPVYWRSGPELSYQRLGPDDVERLRREFESFGRGGVLQV